MGALIIRLGLRVEGLGFRGFGAHFSSKYNKEPP